MESLAVNNLAFLGKEKIFLPSQPRLQPGQILATDVTARNGRFLFAAGHVVSQETIDILLTWGVETAVVREGGGEAQQVAVTAAQELPVLTVRDIPQSFLDTSGATPPQTTLTEAAAALPIKPDQADPQAYIDYLEHAHAFASFALQQAAAMSNFHFLAGRDEPEQILRETAKRVGNLIPFQSHAFFLINETTGGFDLALADPESQTATFTELLRLLIRSTALSTMIWDKGAVTVDLPDSGTTVVAHLINTTSRVRGLFVAVAPEQPIPAEAWALLTMILQSTANALESSQLYALMAQHNQELSAKVAEQTAALRQSVQQLETEVAQRKTAQENLAYIFDNVHDAICIYSPNGTVRDVNAKMLSMFEVDREQALELNVPGDISCRRRNDDACFDIWSQVFERGNHIFEWSAKVPHAENVFPVEIVLKQITWDGELAVLATLRDISKRKEAEQKLEFMAMHDPLTDLPNRNLFVTRLGQAIADSQIQGCAMAVLYIDLDGFKPVNDTYGHTMGDMVLKTLARRLSEVLRRTDTVARLGGDEFGVVVSRLYTETDHQAVMDKIHATVRQPMHIDGATLELGCSIGAAVYPTDGDNVDALLNLADTKMYSEKRGRKRE